MYDNIFTYNFLYSFLSGTIFILINILFSLNLSENKFLKKYFDLDNYQPIVIFFIIFIFYTLIFNILIIFNLNFFFEIFVLILFLQTISILSFLKKSFKFINLDFFFKKKFYILFFLVFYLISILPLSDADSISIYLNLPTTIYNSGLNNINLYKDIEFTLLSNTEILLILSSVLKSENFGSQLNFLSLIFFACTNYKNNKNFLLILISSPLFIYFISAQKLQLFFAILYLLCFLFLYKKNFKNKFEIFIFILLLTFYSSGKVSYILFAVPLFLYLLIKNHKNLLFIILYLLISILIIYLPLFVIKEIHFANFFAPFFDNFFGQNLDIYKAFVSSIRSSEGWLSDPSNLFLYLRPFISFDLSKLSSSLGLIFLFMLLDAKLQKKLFYLPIILIFLVLLTGQILPRYYFEAFLLLSFFYKSESKFIKLIIYSQLAVVFIISVIFIYISYFDLNVINKKKNYMNQFSYSFYNSMQIEKSNLGGNILDFSLDRDSIFFNEKVYSSRYLDILNKYNNNYETNLTHFIQKNSIDYLILQNLNLIPQCIIYEEIGETLRQVSRRNFLVKPQKFLFKIIKIKDIKCN